MRFRIPSHLKEVVTVKRESAFQRGAWVTVAEGIKCMVAPSRELVHLEAGVPIKQTDLRSDSAVLLEVPNAEITEGDLLLRSDGSELKVHGMRTLGHVMLLETNNVSVP